MTDQLRLKYPKLNYFLVNKRFQYGFGDKMAVSGPRCWGLCCVRIRISAGWGVNLFVAGAQVSLLTKRPDVLRLPSRSKAVQRISPLSRLITPQ